MEEAPDSRQTAIHHLRRALHGLGDSQNSLCRTVGELDLFCRGFRGLTDQALEERYGWLAQGAFESRDRLEERANSWELARQEFTEADLPCDVGPAVCRGCGGWDNLSNAALARFCREMP